MKRRPEVTALSLLLAAACAGPDQTAKEETPVASAPPAAVTPVAASGLDLAGFDKAVRPQDDLFRFVNGAWLEKTEIPPDKSNYSMFMALADEAQANIKKIIDELAAGQQAPGTNEQKIADFYRSFMDEAHADQVKLEPLDAELKRIRGLKTKNDVVRELGHQQRLGLAPLMGTYVDQDEKNTTAYILYVAQAGLGLPDRDYYLKEDPKLDEARLAYQQYVEKIFTLAGQKDAKKLASKVWTLEKKLAENHWTRVESRDRDKTYNKHDTKALSKLSPALPWPVFFEGMGMKPPEALVVRQPNYVASLSKRLNEISVPDWKIYLEWSLLNGYAPVLSKDFVDANFAFYGTTLSGVVQNEERWKRAVTALDQNLGEAIGKIYVERHFRPEAKQRMEALVANLRRAFGEGIDSLAWMSPETKAAAKEKLAKFNSKIGYPDKWRDYSALEVKAGDLAGNMMRAREFEHQRQLNKLGQPVDRTEWFMVPQMVNAYYSAEMNEVVFPAAILQPPFFDLDADDAVNYGAIGAVIGHELSHGFDDQGRKSDGDGNLRDWWSKADADQFTQRARLMVSQYNEFEPLPGKKVNGELTLGENIGDLGGMTIAYRAYQLSQDGKAPPVIDGFSGAQRFFLGWAQIWRRKYREPELQKRLVTDPHSPSEYRVAGVVSNMPEFHEAFGVKQGDKLWRPETERVKIW